jgi:S-adenosyl methyltransferase
MSALAPGSYVVISHSTDEFAPDRTHAASAAATERGATWIPRPKDEIARMCDGRDLVQPGLVLVSRWRPETEPRPDADQAWTYGGIVRVLGRLGRAVAGHPTLPATRPGTARTAASCRPPSPAPLPPGAAASRPTRRMRRPAAQPGRNGRSTRAARMPGPQGHASGRPRWRAPRRRAADQAPTEASGGSGQRRADRRTDRSPTPPETAFTRTGIRGPALRESYFHI